MRSGRKKPSAEFEKYEPFSGINDVGQEVAVAAGPALRGILNSGIGRFRAGPIKPLRDALPIAKATKRKFSLRLCMLRPKVLPRQAQAIPADTVAAVIDVQKAWTWRASVLPTHGLHKPKG